MSEIKDNNIYQKGVIKYKKLNEITFESILNYVSSNDCCSEFIVDFKFILKKYGVEFGNLSFKELIDICLTENPERIEWLEDNNFICKELTVCLLVGDIFIIDKTQFMLCEEDYKHFLVNLETGHCTDSINLSDYDDEYNDEYIKDLFNEVDDVKILKILETRIPAGSYSISLKTKKRGKKK